MRSTPESRDDTERNQSEQGFLLNESISHISWQQLTVTVKDRQTKEPKDLIRDVSGSIGRGTIFLF